jgi:hypothetical protein
MQVSDKTMHFAAYLLLSFLLWFAVNPNKKVHWRKPGAWWILFAVVWYGVIDEWLQMYVGRNADVYDFFADLSGAVTGLLILTFVNFWPASLAVTGCGIFVITRFLRTHPIVHGPRLDIIIFICAYLFFTMLWLRYMHNFFSTKAPQSKWILAAITLPVSFMMAIEVFCAFKGYRFSYTWPLLAAASICLVVVMFFVYSFIKQKTITAKLV